MRNKTKIFIAALLVVMLVFIVWKGFDKHETFINEVRTFYEVFKEAEYSELTTGVDYEGEGYTEMDYWQEPISETWRIETINGELYYHSCPIDQGVNVYKCYPPPITVTGYKTGDFDRVDTESSFTVVVIFETGEEERVRASQLPMYVSSIGHKVIVKTWFGLLYSSDLIPD